MIIVLNKKDTPKLNFYNLREDSSAALNMQTISRISMMRKERRIY